MAHVLPPYQVISAVRSGAPVSQFDGFPIAINENYRFGMITIAGITGPTSTGHYAATPGHPMLEMSDDTLVALRRVEAAHTSWVPGQPWYEAAGQIQQAINDVRSTMRTVLVDVSAQLKKPPRKAPAVKRPTDKLDEVCAGISQLVAKMSGYTSKDGRHADDTVLMEFAQEYGRLRDRMRVLRTAMQEADGQFDIAQQQMVHLMEGR